MILATLLLASFGAKQWIGVEPIGDVPMAEILVAASSLRGFGAAILVLPARFPGASSSSPLEAGKVLNDLVGTKPADCVKLMGVTSAPLVTYDEAEEKSVIGLAPVNGSVGVVSTALLRRGVSAEAFSHRLVNATRHEMGHLIGLDHCLNPGCVMGAIEGGMAADREEDFCSDCRAKLKVGNSLPER